MFRRLALASAVALSVFAVSSASAALVHSGVINTSVPGTFDGVYVNVQSGLATTTTTGNANYDFNPYIPTPGTSTTWSFFQPDGANGGTVASSTSGPAVVLNTGDIVGPSSVFKTGTATAGAFSGLTGALVGFKFQIETTPATVHYGWARVTLPTPVVGTTAQPAGTLIEYAYESTPNTALAAGVVPEPTSLAALSLAGFVARRRRA